jgi:hypothetical protein
VVVSSDIWFQPHLDGRDSATGFSIRFLFDRLFEKRESDGEAFMAARIGNITFDCDDALKVGAFWAEVLGRDLDPGSGPGFASIGGGDADRAEPAIYFENVPEFKTVKNRVHLDVVDADPFAVDRFLTLGASVVGEQRMGSHQWTVMQDPEGNEFCVAKASFTG